MAIKKASHRMLESFCLEESLTGAGLQFVHGLPRLKRSGLQTLPIVPAQFARCHKHPSLQ